jgi:hypothetical protein
MEESFRALEMQRINDEEDNTPDSGNSDLHNLCGEDPGTSLGESPLRKTHKLQESVEDKRDVNSGKTALAPHPRDNLRSTASSKQCVPSPRSYLR